ncbi:MAG TPA: PQQ-binding-like beta-propeller repeat protein [Acidobacteriota bacterium]|nr:PQQ-binding-like beta-propeller repeat protein [Acidobacteriota bacterium]
MEGQNLPLEWNGESGHNIRWKREIPGLAHSSPVLWGGRIYLTTAVNLEAESSYKHGLYGAGTAADDSGQVHRWQVYCLDALSGRVIWVRTAHEGRPEFKRHIKSTYASSSPATDGRRLAALFGSQGLFVYDMEGNLLWSKDLGDMDVGAYNAPTYEWGPASSPIITQDMVIVQVDTQQDDFLAAFDAADGKELWRTAREELPSWGTPAYYPGPGPAQIVTNGSNYIRAYDPFSGQEIWRLGGSSKITAPTPVFNQDRIIVASGRSPEKPIFAVSPQARGDITLQGEETSSDAVLWSKRGRGPYMPTPLIYGDYLYSLNNNGILDCYRLSDGEEIYRQRVGHAGGGFSASPVASGGLLYLSSEDGEVLIIEAGPVYREVARNELGERIMATPALGHDTLYVRAENHLFAIGR